MTNEAIAAAAREIATFVKATVMKDGWNDGHLAHIEAAITKHVTAAPDAAAEPSPESDYAQFREAIAEAEHDERERVRRLVVERVRAKAEVWDAEAMLSGRAFSDKARVANLLATKLETMPLTEGREDAEV